MYCVPVGVCVSSVNPWFFDVFPPDICPVCVYEGGDCFFKLRYSGILWRVFVCSVSVCYFVAYGVRQEFVCVTYPAYWYVFLPAWYSMWVNVLLALCMSVSGCIAVKASSMSCVNLFQSAFL